MILVLAPPTLSNNIEMLKMKNPQLPIQLGKAKLVYSKHTFIHYIDLLPIINQLKDLGEQFNIIKNHLENQNFTNQISFHGISENSLRRTEYLVKNTQDKLANLYPHMRSKRGLINFIGNMQKWLFGHVTMKQSVTFQIIKETL